LKKKKPKKEVQQNHDSQFKHPGSWFFTRRVLSALENPALKKQLPFSYSLFATFAKMYFVRTGKDFWKGGRNTFLFLRFFRNLMGLKSFINLKIGDDWVCIDLNDPRFLQVLNEIQNKVHGIQHLANLLSPGDTFIDVGANHGSFSLAASRLVGSKGLVIAVEPQARKAKATETTLQMNGHSSFLVHRVALGNINSEIKLLIPKDTSGSAGIYKKFSGIEAHTTEKVPMKRFDDLFGAMKMPGKVVMKIDIEGSEYIFLDGAKEIIKMKHPVLLMEINPKAMRAADVDGGYFVKILKKLGYQSFLDVQSTNGQQSIDVLRTEIFQHIILR